MHMQRKEIEEELMISLASTDLIVCSSERIGLVSESHYEKVGVWKSGEQGQEIVLFIHSVPRTR